MIDTAKKKDVLGFTSPSTLTFLLTGSYAMHLFALEIPKPHLQEISLLSAVYNHNIICPSPQYWHDPLNLTNYVHGSHYLAIVNNEVEDKESLYK